MPVRALPLEVGLRDLVGPTRVVGGPRSGKTQLLVELAVEWLLGGGDPKRLVLVVRSGSSAALLQRRVEAMLPGAHPAPLVQTHERLARAVLATVGESAKPAVRLSRVGEWLAMREALSRARASLPRLGELVAEPSCIDDALAVTSAFKRALVGPGLLAQRLRGAPVSLREMVVVAASYQTVLEQMGSRDPRDWHGLALTALEDPSAMRDWAEVMLVDEAEDLSPAQWFLVRELGRRLSPPGRLVLAGHWSESAPGFRGVSSECSSRPFEQYFPSEMAADEWVLPSALRGWSQALVAELGLGTDEQVEDQSGAEAQTAAEAAFRVSPTARVWQAVDETGEAMAVAREILRARLAGEVDFGDVAVLVRSPGSQLVPIQAALSSLGIPHRLHGGGGWTGDPVVAVVRNWLRVLCSHHDDQALLTALGMGPQAVSPAAIAALRRDAGLSNCSVTTVFWAAMRSDQNPDAAEWDELRRAGRPWLRLGAGDPGVGGRELDWPQLRALLGELELAAGLAAAALENLEVATVLAELTRVAAETAEATGRLNRPRRSLTAWLELLELAVRHAGGEEPDRESDRSEVSVLTISQAKGGAWSRVFLCGCVDGTIPAPVDSGGMLDAEEVSELVRLVPELEDVLSSGDSQQDAESRLFLVALTRATAGVTCSWARRYRGRPAERSPLLQALIAAGCVETAAPHAELVTADDLLIELSLVAVTPEPAPPGRDPLGSAAADLRQALAPWDPVADGAGTVAGPVSISATSLASWLACPRQYLAHTLELAHDRGINLTLGVQAHQLLQRLYQGKADWEDRPLGFRTAAAELLREKVMPEVRAEEWDPLKVLFAELWLGEMVSRWERRVVAAGESAVGEPIAEEVSFELPRSGWRLRGKVDALWRHPDGEVELVDYKTSRFKSSDAALRAEVFGKPHDGPKQWQLPIYQLAARDGAFEDQLGRHLPARVRNWYVGVEPSSKGPDPISAAGFRVVTGAEEEGGAGVLTERELDRIEAEINRVAEAILGGRFPAQPRHALRTCRDSRSGCPVAFWCDGEGSVGVDFPTPAPEL
ncbi:MAG: ATP-dependent DNA helicase [Candidatus Dormiibacterota bacterium]